MPDDRDTTPLHSRKFDMDGDPLEQARIAELCLRGFLADLETGVPNDAYGDATLRAVERVVDLLSRREEAATGEGDAP